MINHVIKIILIVLIIFTPIAFGSLEIWAFSIMELGILLVLVLWAVQSLILRTQPSAMSHQHSSLKTSQSAIRNPKFAITMILISLFLLLVLFQMIALPPSILKMISPQAHSLRLQLQMTPDPLPMTPLSFFPFATQIEFFKWLTLSGLFLVFLYGRPLNRSGMNSLILAVFSVGVFESLYGMFEFFSGHRQILHLKMDDLVSSVTGTFINRNAFAGYLLMVIPLSLGYLFSRESHQMGLAMGWRRRLSSLDGKALLIAFGIVLMILALLFSASRMGIASLLLSFSLISLLFRHPEGRQRLSRPSVLILGLAVLWAAWIGLDAVISRFFTTSESVHDRWVFWASTLQIVRDYPLFGSGLGTFIQVFPMYRSFHVQGIVTHAENDFLQLASEVGLLGIGLLGILFIYLFYKAVSGIRSLTHGEPERYVGMGAVVGILALMFHSLVEKNIQLPANAFLYTLLWVMVFWMSAGGVPGSKDPKTMWTLKPNDLIT